MFEYFKNEIEHIKKDGKKIYLTVTEEVTKQSDFNDFWKYCCKNNVELEVV